MSVICYHRRVDIAVKVFAVLLLLAMIFSLFQGLYFLYRDPSSSTRTLKALKTRISIWVVLFAVLCVSLYTGVIKPSNSVRPDWATQRSDSNPGS